MMFLLFHLVSINLSAYYCLSVNFHISQMISYSISFFINYPLFYISEIIPYLMFPLMLSHLSSFPAPDLIFNLESRTEWMDYTSPLNWAHQ